MELIGGVLVLGLMAWLGLTICASDLCSADGRIEKK